MSKFDQTLIKLRLVNVKSLLCQHCFDDSLTGIHQNLVLAISDESGNSAPKFSHGRRYRSSQMWRLIPSCVKNLIPLCLMTIGFIKMVRFWEFVGQQWMVGGFAFRPALTPWKSCKQKSWHSHFTSLHGNCLRIRVWCQGWMGGWRSTSETWGSKKQSNLQVAKNCDFKIKSSSRKTWDFEIKSFSRKNEILLSNFQVGTFEILKSDP